MVAPRLSGASNIAPSPEPGRAHAKGLEQPFAHEVLPRCPGDFLGDRSRDRKSRVGILEPRTRLGAWIGAGNAVEQFQTRLDRRAREVPEPGPETVPVQVGGG